jgi:hypothetical protein
MVVSVERAVEAPELMIRKAANRFTAVLQSSGKQSTTSVRMKSR